MFYWAVVFLFVAVIAGIFGFGGLATNSSELSKTLFFVSLGLFALTSLTGLIRKPQI